MKLTAKEIEAIQLALMSSDYWHCEEPLSERITEDKDRKAMISAFSKFGLTLE